MKKIILFLSLLATFSIVQAQLLKKIKEKVDRKVDKTIDDGTNGKKDEKKNTGENETSQTNTNNPSQPASFKSYSKYDFVPGEKVIGFEDFSTGSIGDFPAGWNTNASGEIVTIEGKEGRWLWLTKPGVFVPELAQEYPEDFTFEFDLLHGVPINGAYFTVGLAELSDRSKIAVWTYETNNFSIELDNANTGTDLATTRFTFRKNSVSDAGSGTNPTILSDKNNPVHVAIWRQKERVRVYVNQEKLWDIPRAAVKEAKFNTIFFSVTYADEGIKHYIGNLRLAVGAPDTRKKFLEQNKWVTHGILFDVNSATIKPESYGTLKEMATVLKENPDLKVKIIGHTDADGKDADNLDLSKKRSASVKAALAKEFGIDESRMETDGKGESEPIDKNDTPAGKANNRRVEFIKI
jgi:outer membrane protein OmpA-like peptidoglycan-associated protein